MLKYGSKLSAIIISSLLIGCSTHWVKPNGSSPLWDLDECSSEAEARYPIKNEVVYRSRYDYRDISICTEEARKKHYGSCPVSLPTWKLDNDIVDVNSYTRDSFISGCMKRRGWIREYKYF